MDFPVFGLPEAADDFGFTAREQAPEMIEFINQIDPKGVAAMTQDWGGPTGIFATQMRPERIDRLIIGNTFSWPLIDVGARVFSSIMDGLLGRSSVFLFNGVARFFFTRGVVNKLPPDVLNMYLAPFKSRKMRYPTQIFPKQLMAAKSFLQELENGLSATKDKPTLIVRGDSDFAFKERERNPLRAAFPNHRDIRLNGAGHLIQEDAPDAISGAIADWYGGKASKSDAAPNDASDDKSSLSKRHFLTERRIAAAGATEQARSQRQKISNAVGLTPVDQIKSHHLRKPEETLCKL